MTMTPPASLTDIFSSLSSLSTLQQKAVASILGATVADAAARPLHWVYDMEEMADLMKEKRFPEFWPESRSPFYTIPLGGKRSLPCKANVTQAW